MDDSGRHKRRRTVEENIRSMLYSATHLDDTSSSTTAGASNLHTAGFPSTSTGSPNQQASTSLCTGLVNWHASGSSSTSVSTEAAAAGSSHYTTPAESTDMDNNRFSDSSDSSHNIRISHSDDEIDTISELFDSVTVSDAADTDADDLNEHVLAGIINDAIGEGSLRNKLQYWAVTKGITHEALRALLHILHQYHLDLPLDPRTLLSTGTVSGIASIEGGGFYYHFGVANGIKKWLDGVEYRERNIHIQFNIDGLPLFKSSKIQLWPILAIWLRLHESSLNHS